MRPKIISVINFCWAEREDKNIHSAGVNITQSRQRVGVICHWRRDSEAAGEPSPGFHRLVLQGRQRTPQQPLQNPFLLCCRAELAFSGAAFPCRKVPAQGVTHTLCSVFLNPRCRNSSSSGPISVPLHLRSCGITFPPKDPPCALKAPGQGKQNNLPSLRLILHPKCYSDNF